MFSSGIWHFEKQVVALNPTFVDRPFVSPVFCCCCLGAGSVKPNFISTCLQVAL